MYVNSEENTSQGEVNCTTAVHSRRVHLARVARDETGRVRLSTLLPRALNPREARARRRCTDESENNACVGNFGFSVSQFCVFFSKFWFFPPKF